MHVSIRLDSHWDLVEPAGELLRRAATVALGSGPVADEVSIASRELLENTVKYSAGGDAQMSLLISDDAIQITVENQPEAKHLETLRLEIEKLSKLEDSLQHYMAKMAIAAKAEVGKSGLGLARIRHECNMTLSMQQLGPRVRIIASRPR